MPETVIDPIEEAAAAASDGTGGEAGAGGDGGENGGEGGESTEVITTDAATRIEKIVQGIKEGMDKKPPEGAGGNTPSPEQIRKAWVTQVSKETGMTDKQIEYMENRLAAVLAPYEARDKFNEWKAEKGEVITPEIEKSVREYLKQYNPMQQADKVLLDNVLAMELGKQVLKGRKAAAPAKTTTEPTPARRTIVPTTPAPATSLAGGAPAKTGATALTKEELEVARKMRMTPEDYAAAKQTAVISDLKKK